METKRPLGEQYTDSDPLMHYGILGMKWGRRKDGKPQGFQYGKAAKRTTPSDDYVKSRELKRNPTATLSNNEIQSVVARLNLERQLAKLDPTSFDKGYSKVKKILAVSGTLTGLVGLAATPGGKMVRDAVVKILKK